MNIHSFVASLSTSNATTSNSQVTSNFQLPKLPTVRKLVGSWTLGVGWELGVGNCVVGDLTASAHFQRVRIDSRSKSATLSMISSTHTPAITRATPSSM